MSELTNKKTQLLRKRLLANRVEITTAIEGETKTAATVELDQSAMGRLSRMDALQVQAMSQETKSRHEESLRKISSALSKIESSDYGYCLKCDELISFARLEANPAAPLCIACATSEEQA